MPAHQPTQQDHSRHAGQWRGWPTSFPRATSRALSAHRAGCLVGNWRFEWRWQHGFGDRKPRPKHLEHSFGIRKRNLHELNRKPCWGYTPSPTCFNLAWRSQPRRDLRHHRRESRHTRCQRPTQEHDPLKASELSGGTSDAPAHHFLAIVVGRRVAGPTLRFPPAVKFASRVSHNPHC